MYTLSKNHEELYCLVKSGQTVVCFVDYSWNEKTLANPSRDVCKCYLNAKTKEITFGIRGMSYGQAYAWEDQEKEFISECERLNVEWIVGNQDQATG